MLRSAHSLGPVNLPARGTKGSMDCPHSSHTQQKPTCRRVAASQSLPPEVRMRFRNALIMVPALVAIGCSAPAADTAEKASAEDVAAVRQAIEAVNAQFTAAAKAGDAAAVAGFYTADAWAMQPNAPSAQGTEGIKAMFQGMVDAVTLTEFTL